MGEQPYEACTHIVHVLRPVCVFARGPVNVLEVDTVFTIYTAWLMLGIEQSPGKDE